MSDNCYKLYLIDGNLQLISHEEAEEIERRNRMVTDLSLLLVEIQNMRKRWADEDAADESLIPECSFDESWIDYCDAVTESNINCGDWS